MYSMRFNQLLLRFYCSPGLAEQFGKGQKYSDIQCGTPLFSAPEILSEKQFDFRVDVWSAGVMMYHIILNQQPFPAKSMDQLKNMVCTNTPVPL